MSFQNSTRFSTLKILLHFSFFIVGIVTVLLGQILPILALNLSLNDEQSGFFFTAQFGGSIIGTVSTAFLIKQFGFVRTLGLAFFLFVVGLGGINFGGLEISRASVFIYGIGIGLAIPSTLMLTAALNPVKTTSALNLMSFVWGLGAIASQPFVSFLGREKFVFPTLLLAAVSILFATAYLVSFKNFEVQGNNSDSESNTTGSVWSNPKSWLIVAFGFCDVGIESGISGWLTSYTFRSDLPTEISWLSATPIFFAFFVAGRGVAAIIARFLSNNQIIWVSLSITFLGTVLLILSAGWQTIFVSAAILGLGLAAVFPTNMARFTETFGPGANEKTVPLFVMGSVGSITITWLIGYISNLYANSLKAGLVVLLGAAVVLIILQILFQTSGKSKATPIKIYSI
jgi:MFS transporter, FHS family, glucose/mannose:H+ symporter